MTVKDILPVLLMSAKQSIYFRTNSGERLNTVSYGGTEPGIDEQSDIASMEVMHITWTNKTAYVIVK